MKTQALKFTLAALALSPVFALGAEDDVSQKNNFIDTALFSSPDQSDLSVGLKWNFEWEKKWDWSQVRIATSGAWAVDEELSQTPIVGEINAGGFRRIAGEQIKHGEEADTDAALRARRKDSAIGFKWGVTGRYETDQPHDHSNAVAGAFIGLHNTNQLNLLCLVPSVYLSVDAVFQDENASVRAAGGDLDNHGRFFAAANWEVPFEVFGSGWLLRRTQFHGAVEFTHSFATSAAFESTGQDDTFAWLVELLFTLDEGLDEKKQLPLYFYVQYASGRFAPQPEDEQRILAGIRLKF